MHFCPLCKFMVYTQLSKVDGQKKILQNYCKNCGWSDDYQNQDQSNLIYHRNYQEDYIADKIVSNRYTIFDYTLPRVTYPCINDKCATLLSSSNTSNRFMVNNIPADESPTVVSDTLKQNINIEEFYPVKLTSGVIQVKEGIDMETVKEWCKKQSISDQTLTCSDYHTPGKEVLYIKYDSINMKYLYICAVCGTSWKKN